MALVRSFTAGVSNCSVSKNHSCFAPYQIVYSTGNTNSGCPTMAKTKNPIQQVNICLIKSSVSLPTGALESPATLTSINATATTLPNGVLYYKPANPKPASWRSFVSSGFNASSLPPFLSETPSALLFFKAGPPKNQRLFAVTFGYARSWLKQSALEADFGLRTALNLCEPDTLRAVDFRTIEERSRISRVQLSEAGSVDAFQMNMDTSLLRGVEAESKDKKVCERLGARWHRPHRRRLGSPSPTCPSSLNNCSPRTRSWASRSDSSGSTTCAERATR